MAGCSAEDELGNGSAAQQLSMTPMVNDLQTTRVKEEENLHEKTLSSLDFKMFGPTSSERRIDSLFDAPAENKAEELGSGNWKESLNLQSGQSYAFYAAANASQSLQGKSLDELQKATQKDDDIWMPYSTDNSKKLFLMSSHGSYKITEKAEQNIPVELVRAAAKIKLNISSTVKDYHISDVQWKLINYNTNTTIFAGADQTATPSIIPDNNTWSPAASAEDEKGNKVFTVTTYSYSTQWETQIHGLAAELRVQRDGLHRKIKADVLAQLRKANGQRYAVLAAGNAHHHLVAGGDHFIVLHSLAHQAAQTLHHIYFSSISASLYFSSISTSSVSGASCALLKS